MADGCMVRTGNGANAVRAAALGVASLAAVACAGVQSTLDAHGREAEAIAGIAWLLSIGGGVIFVLVMGLVALAVWQRPAWLGRHSVILIGGLVFPVVTLGALLVHGLVLERELEASGTPARLSVDVIGEQFWWRVHYRDRAGGPAAASANEIRVPVGVPVELHLQSRDVIHSFWAPSLAGKLDMIPGRTNRLRIEATRAGIYRGQCAEYCGAQHANMAFYVVAMEPAAFDAWLERERGPAIEPQSPALERGRALFLEHCSACHTIRGTGAHGLLGPDLTHFGSRHSVAAGVYPNNLGTLAAWIASAQHLKPGSRMPSFRRFSGEELTVLARYLESLE